MQGCTHEKTKEKYSKDEIELITDLQFHVSPRVFIRVNNAFGVTSKATDYAPELGILFRF